MIHLHTTLLNFLKPQEHKLATASKARQNSNRKREEPTLKSMERSLEHLDKGEQLTMKRNISTGNDSHFKKGGRGF